MNNAPYKNEKGKNKPRDWVVEVRRTIIAVLLFVLAVPFACLVSYMILILIAYHVAISPFDPQEIAQTCRALSLPPDSAFCRAEGNQNTDELRAIIEQTYPVGITTRSQLEDRFTATFYCYDDRGYCHVSLPITSVYVRIRFNDEGDVLSYDIDDERGSWPG